MNLSSLTSGFIGKVISKIANPTAAIDEYLAENILPRLAKDAALLENRFCRAKRYPFNDKTNNPKPLNVVLQERRRNSSSKKTETNDGDDNTNNTANKKTGGISLQDIRDRISVSNVDCLLRAKQFKNEKLYKNVSVLNMANEYNCGGAWSVHSGSQEEYVFRNSTLPFSLWKHRRLDQDGFRPWDAGTKVLGPAKEEDRWYPFSIFGGIYSDPVEVFSVEDKVLSKLNPPEEVFEISVLTIAAQDLRNRNSAFPKQVFNLDILRGKMRTLFFMAIENEADCLVLSALGSGAFLNPPEEVAKMFKEVLKEICDGCESVEDFPFKKIDFAIIKSKENLAAYEKVFGDLS